MNLTRQIEDLKHANIVAKSELRELQKQIEEERKTNEVMLKKNEEANKKKFA